MSGGLLEAEASSGLQGLVRALCLGMGVVGAHGRQEDTVYREREGTGGSSISGSRVSCPSPKNFPSALFSW